MNSEKSKYSSTLFEKHIARPIMEGSPKQFKPKNAIRKFLLTSFASNILLHALSSGKDDRAAVEAYVDRFFEENGLYSEIDRVLLPVNFANTYMKLKESLYGSKFAKTDLDESVHLEGNTYETV